MPIDRVAFARMVDDWKAGRCRPPRPAAAPAPPAGKRRGRPPTGRPEQMAAAMAAGEPARSVAARFGVSVQAVYRARRKALRRAS